MTQFLGRYNRVLILLAALSLSASCSMGSNESTIDPDTGKHSATWIADHPSVYQKNQSSCSQCHGPDLKGGISQVSCFSVDRSGTSCHANGPAGHPEGWASPDSHGASAKSAPDQSAGTGLSACATCHNTDLSGQSGPSCLNTAGCHGEGVAAPHSPAPWRSADRTHTTTDQANADACALCHLGNRNPASYVPLSSGALVGCFDNTLCHDTIGHAAGWSDPAQHGTTAENDFSACKTCHGATYQGGTVTVTCYDCHNGPGLDHPAAAWVVADHKTAALADSTTCRKCHGADYLGGGANVACNSCHMEDRTKVHLLSWYSDVQLNHRAYALTNGTTSCSNQYCHGTGLEGVTGSGPSCSTCHSWPFSEGACGSCHAIPPSGTVSPDVAGRHSVHTGLGSFITCDTCHSGSGSGTVNHQNGTAEVKLADAYNAKSGAGAFNATGNTCASVSCHGGKTSPDWPGGTIDVNSQCTTCHSYGTAQYNGFTSGRHDLHVNSERFGCTECHDTAKLATVHFDDLNTSAMTQAWKTLLGSMNYTGTGSGTYGNCTVACHGESHSGRRW